MVLRIDGAIGIGGGIELSICKIVMSPAMALGAEA